MNELKCRDRNINCTGNSVTGDGNVSEIFTSRWTAARIVGLSCGDKDNGGGGGGGSGGGGGRGGDDDGCGGGDYDDDDSNSVQFFNVQAQQHGKL